MINKSLNDSVITKSKNKKLLLGDVTISIKYTKKQNCIQFINKLVRSRKKRWIKIQ